MKLLFLIFLVFSVKSFANFPPTTTKGSGDSADVTTFKFLFPNVTISHSGTSATFGTVGVASGGTGAVSLTANNVLLGNGTSAVQVVAPSTSGNVLTSNGTTWQSVAANSTYAYTAKTANYTATSSDLYISNNSSGGGYTISLPTAVGITGKIYIFDKTDTSTNLVTVDASGTETIGGYLTVEMGSKNDYLGIISNGTNWEILSWDVNVSASYTTNAGQSIPDSTDTTVVYEDLVYNTHPTTYNTGTGIYTVRYAGAYEWGCGHTLSSTTNNWGVGEMANNYAYITSVNVGRTFQRMQATVIGSYIMQPPRYTTTSKLVVGDTVYCQSFQTSGVTLTLSTSGTENQFSIQRVGN